MSTPSALALQAGLLVAWACLMLFGRALPRAARLALLASLTLAALAVHVDYPRYHGRGERVQYHDFFHYYIGTKYFAEVGYTGLYEAATVADSLDAPEVLRRAPEIRSLEDYWVESKPSVLARAQAIARPFSKERWLAFRAELDVFRSHDPQRWAQSVLRDHGYNGPPLLTALLGGLGAQPWLSTATFVKWASALDGLLVLATALALALVLGSEVALSFLFFFGANPLNDYFTVGGSYLRYLHLCTTALAVAAVTQRAWWTGGGLFALAVHLRGLPALLVLALPLHQLLQRDRWSRLRASRGFYLALAGVGLALFAATLSLSDPSGRNVWSSFQQKLALHGSNLVLNCIGLPYPFMYTESANAAVVARSWPSGARLNWVDEAQRTLERRRAAHWAASALLLALSFVVLWRARRTSEALLAGPLWAYTFLMLAHYDYVWLALVPLLYLRRPSVEAVLALGLALTACARFVPGAAEWVDLRFAAASLGAGATLVAVALAGLRTERAAVSPEP